MNKRTAAKLLREIEKSKGRIAKERDKLRALVDEADEVLDTCNDAEVDLQRAIDTLSQYV